ncbi:hypothetical protein SISSUDRAFT_417307 [Sistotremastrum suecicum HHB10207 ss-3]|nr:hypothetical protein SISSUDRAFT_417307 [Sistotremastrum suecicum HHB10207 ss-3]
MVPMQEPQRPPSQPTAHPAPVSPSSGGSPNVTFYDMAQRLAEQADAEGKLDDPNKKKRKRQTLSCVECKRRKVKCDQQNPCGACSRRNEPDKCKWTTVDRMKDEYVPHKEHEELRRRLEVLESIVARLTSQQPMLVPYPQPGHPMPPPHLAHMVPGPQNGKPPVPNPYMSWPPPGGPAGVPGPGPGPEHVMAQYPAHPTNGAKVEDDARRRAPANK